VREMGKEKGRESPPTQIVKTTLQKLLDEYRGLRGLNRVYFIGRIRQYVASQNHQYMLEEIYKITDLEDIKPLIAVGMRGELFTATIGQQARLKGLI
jgi:hypothetical protein